MSTAELTLYQKRGKPQNVLTRTSTALNKFTKDDPPSKLTLKEYEGLIRKAWSDFEALHDDILDLLNKQEKADSTILEEKVEQAESIFSDVQEKYFRLLNQLEALSKLVPGVSPTEETISKLELLSRKFNTLLSRYQPIELYVESEDEENARSSSQVTKYVSEIQEITRNLRVLESDAAACLSSVNYTSFDKTCRDFHKRLERTELLLIDLQVDLNSTTASDAAGSASGSNGGVRIKLPTLDLPSFNGEILEWKSFSDLFTAAIRSRNDLSGAQKLQFLNKAIEKGDAKKVISSLPIQDNNYQIAWDLLVARYEDSREAISNLMKKLLDQPKMNSESYECLRGLVDNTSQCLRGLKSYGMNTKGWGELLVYTVSAKLDRETRKQWLLSHPGTEWPKFDELMNYLESRAKTLSQVDGTKKKPDDKPTRDTRQRSNVKVHHVREGGCPSCRGSHRLSQCPQWKKATVEDRESLIRKAQLCWKCLSTGHGTKDCDKLCPNCDKGHSAWICYQDKRNLRNPRSPSSAQVQPPSHASQGEKSEKSGPKGTKTVLYCHGSQKSVLLETCSVLVKDNSDKLWSCRVFLDGGAEADFILKESADKVDLPFYPANTVVTGLGGSQLGKCQSSMKLTLTSQWSDEFITIDALVVEKLTANLPKKEVDPTQWPELKDLQLADPEFYKSGKVNVLLGAASYAKIRRQGFKRLGENGPTAQETMFGWVLQGEVDPPRSLAHHISVPNCQDPLPHYENVVSVAYADLQELEKDVKKMYEIEDGPFIASRHTETHQKCEEHFVENYSRDPKTGRYIVKLPFREGTDELGNSSSRAKNQFLSMEKKFVNKPAVYSEYIKVFKDYISCGYMEEVPDNELVKPDNECFYLTHHAVLKESSTTTKVRPVFNASAKTTTGLSLNDLLLDGPNLQDDIVPLILRFGKHAVPLKADAKQWYLQFQVHHDHRDFQRIYWRENPQAQLKVWRFKVVVFGEGPAAFLAQRCQQQLCIDEKASFPSAAHVLSNDCYRDDLVSGASSTEDAITLHQEIVELLSRGGLEMRKWASSDQAFLSTLPADQCEFYPFEINDDTTVKTLGIVWHAKGDYYSFKIKPIEENQLWTKRTLLSDNARMYDPLGWMSPVTIVPRILMQKSWTVKMDWDDVLPEDILEPFLKYRTRLHLIEKLKLPRKWMYEDSSTVQLCGFSDASDLAYSAVVYLRSQRKDDVEVKMVYAKARVSPISSQSINRLELEGALLLAESLQMVRDSLQIGEVPLYAWTDSTVVLSWMSKQPCELKTFERNRVAKIQRILPREYWRHVRGIDNPADCASRGIEPGSLMNHSLWWSGPKWLVSDNYLFTEDDSDWDLDNNYLIAVKDCAPTSNNRWKMLERVSTLLRLQCATACFFRALRRMKGIPIPSNVYSSEEMNAALELWIRLCQSSTYSAEIARLQEGKTVDDKSPLKTLAPFLDNGLIRLGGRLQYSHLPGEAKHPFVLPSRHRLTLLIVQDYHRKTLHGGRQLMESLLLRKFYIVQPGNLYKQVIRGCNICDKFTNHPETQFMAPLPESRVTQRHPFQRCGVDYAGPFLVKNVIGRKVEHVKAYVAIFVCLVTKAVHLELVSNASTSNFIGALRRFVATRGYPSSMYSDQGTNFEGANNELQRWLKLLRKEGVDEEFQHELKAAGINWKFNPPGAPHFGGLWEAAVHSMKHHLKRVLLGNVLTYETMSTLIKQIEACLNSRPLTAVSSDPNDFAALTPGHLLIGRPLLDIPSPDLDHLKQNQLDQWQSSQKLYQEFWRRWAAEYLPRLQRRGKWHTARENAAVGDLVRVVDENQPPMKWKLGRIVFLHPGKDNLHRVATIKVPRHNLEELKKKKTVVDIDSISVKCSELVRPLVKLCLLPKIEFEK